MAVTSAPPPAARPRARIQNRRRLWLVGGLVALAVGFLVFQGLGNATVYFKTADEAVRDKRSLGTHRFRIEGTVVDGSVQSQGQQVAFTIKGDRETVAVVHRGDPPELFREGLPAVLEGKWAGGHFASDRIMVKHTEQYREENPDRTKDYPPTSEQ